MTWLPNTTLLLSNVADPDTGSGIRCIFDPWIRDPDRFFPDPGSRNPNTYFWEHIDNFLGKKFYNSLKIQTGPNFFLQHFKNKIIFIFVKFVATKKGMTTNFFSTLSFVAVFGSRIRDPGPGMGKNQDLGSGIKIPDQQHCYCQTLSFSCPLEMRYRYHTVHGTVKGGNFVTFFLHKSIFFSKML
jgi:hypothetical protein